MPGGTVGAAAERCYWCTPGRDHVGEHSDLNECHVVEMDDINIGSEIFKLPKKNANNLYISVLLDLYIYAAINNGEIIISQTDFSDKTHYLNVEFLRGGKIQIRDALIRGMSRQPVAGA